MWRFSPIIFVLVLTLLHTRCSNEVQLSSHLRQNEFLSLSYNHFKDGVLFTDIQTGLEVLWSASFNDGQVYKENLGVFIPAGLLIFPNTGNTPRSSKLSALPQVIRDKKLFVLFNGEFHEVLAIIHSHPDLNSLPMPSPQRDYQFCYLGIHNYVMDFNNLFDAFKNDRGEEIFVRLGTRTAYTMIPFASTIILNGKVSTKSIPGVGE